MDDNCPKMTCKFECKQSPETCRNECDYVSACLLCVNARDCTDIQKRMYVKTELTDVLVIEPIVIPASMVQEFVIEHGFLELRLEEMRKELAGLSWLRLARMIEVKRGGNEVKLQLVSLREFLDKIGVKYEKKCKIKVT